MSHLTPRSTLRAKRVAVLRAGERDTLDLISTSAGQLYVNAVEWVDVRVHRDAILHEDA